MQILEIYHFYPMLSNKNYLCQPQRNACGFRLTNPSNSANFVSKRSAISDQPPIPSPQAILEDA